MTTTDLLREVAAQVTRLVEALADGETVLAFAIAQQLDHELAALLDQVQLGSRR